MSRVLPILFNTNMVRAILDGRKTVTRRCVKYKYDNTEMKMRTDKYGTRLVEIQRDVEGETFGKNQDGSSWHKLLGYVEPKPPYRPGDILYVRETWAKMECCDCNIEDCENAIDRKGLTIECNDGVFIYRASDFLPEGYKWHPSIHMPKEAARIWLKVTDVRVERLREIANEKDGWSTVIHNIEKEGLKHEQVMEGYELLIKKFKDLWNSTINKSDLDRYGWGANPWVWVIEFERCEKPESIT